MVISAPISTGELIDKITILEIKSEKMNDKKKLIHVQQEYNMLTEILENTISDKDLILKERAKLKEINEKLWSIEDDIRAKESDSCFDGDFIQLARAVYITNDKRAAIKKEINMKSGSTLVEEKSYQDY